MWGSPGQVLFSGMVSRVQSIFSTSRHLGMLQSYQKGNSNRLMQLGKRFLSEGSKMSKRPLEDLVTHDLFLFLNFLKDRPYFSLNEASFIL